MSGDFEDIPLDPIPTDQNNDDGDDETTQPFEPGATSTPYPEGGQTETPTLSHEESGFPNTSYDEDTPDLTQRLQKTRENSSWNDLTDMYGNANKSALEAFYEKDKQGNPRLYVKMVGRGKKKTYPLFTKNAVTRQLRETHSFHKKSKIISESQCLTK